MASREKKPLAPSKSKQKANSDSSLSPNEVKNKKGKPLPNIKQQQLAQEVFDTVTINSQLPVKVQASLPRKNALKHLRRRKYLRATKTNLIKSKIGRKVTDESIHRIASDIKRDVKTKKVKQLEESTIKAADIAVSENQINNGDNESKGTETPSKSAKNNLRTKKTKSAFSRSIEEAGNEGIQNKEEAGAASSTKSSPKFGRKGKTIESSDSLSKSAKAVRLTNLKKNSSKENFIKATEGDNKGTKGRKNTGKDFDCGSSTKSNSSIERFPKTALDSKSSIDLTIDEVIASMLSDSEVENQTDKIEGKVTRSKKMLVDENIACDVEIKKEPDIDDPTKVGASDGEYTEADQGFSNAIQLRKRSKAGGNTDQTSQRSLRNGKQRQLSDSGNSTDNDPKKRHRLNSDGTQLISDNLIEHISDCNINMDSFFSDPNCNESQTIVATNKDEICLMKDEASKNFDDDETALEVENNNNSDRVDRTSETGPTLRSKTKVKTMESETAKDDDVKTEDTRITSKCAETQEESKKLYNVDQVRKESILAKYADKSKGRRSSLNVENMKKTANSIYNTDKSDGNSLQIDQMIENIKLNIAKSIESKIFNPETRIALNKNFDVPKIEEVIAPVNAESQKMGLEENTDEDRSLVTKNEITSENLENSENSENSETSENSVPKVADTAKEIEEKLVIFDIEEAETHSQNIQEDRASNNDRINDVHNTCESTCNISNSNDASCNNGADKSEVEDVGCGTASDTTSVNINDNDSLKSSDENNKKIATRKSSRINDKNTDSAANNSEVKKSNKSLNKMVSKSDNAEDDPVDNATSERTENVTSCQLSDNNAVKASLTPVVTSASSEEHAEEQKFAEELERNETKRETKGTRNCEIEISPSVSCASDEFETLESISRDVERLVADDQFIKSSQDDHVADDRVTDVRNKEEIFNANTSSERVQEQEIQNSEKKSEQERVSACCDDKSASLESSAASSNDDANEPPSNSHTDEKADATDETLQEDDSSCKVAQSAKHLKTNNNNNNHLPQSTTANCDSSSECNPVNPAPSRCTPDRWNNKAEDLVQVSNCKESNKSNDAADSDENASDQKSEHNDVALTADQSNKSADDKDIDEQKPVKENEENRRVLRTRDKQKRVENKQIAPRGREHSDNVRIKTEEIDVQKSSQSSQSSPSDANAAQSSALEGVASSENSQKTENTQCDSQNSHNSDANDLEPQARTRRSRDAKKRKDEPSMSNSSKIKRVKRDLRKSDQQKEETLLDNEVAKINENDRSFLNKYGRTAAKRTDSFHGFFKEDGSSGLDKMEKSPNLRSKSENDIIIDATGKGEERLSRNLSENHVSKQTAENIDMLREDCKALVKTQKDSDEASTSGESSNSGTPQILETPEDKQRKESILRILGLESLEEAAKRQSQQKTKKEQLSTGTLKTVIRISKEKDKDKRGSRSPLKMVLKQQQARGDGEGDLPEVYTIQKECGTSGLGESSSGANRKFTTNHRHSCDDENEETPSQLVIPEKSSSFSIHPGRICVDICCYCFGKFGSLDTPMHLAQMKSDERRKKILNVERHLTKDSCLCDACYRHVDRKANTSPANMQQKPQKQHRQLMMSKCSARECRDPARHHVKRRWLLKIKTALQNQVDIDWESSQHTTMSFCVSHYEKIGRFLTCALCKRRLARNSTHQLTIVEINDLNQVLSQQAIPVVLTAGTFVCKLCRYFTQLHLKYKEFEKMNMERRTFSKSYRRRILHYLGVEVEDEDDHLAQQTSQVKDKKAKKGTKSAQQFKSGSSKSPDRMTSGTSEKSTPEPNKNETVAGCISSEVGNESRTAKGEQSNINGDENDGVDVRYLNGIESAVENLKKRKMLDMHAYTSTSISSSLCDGTTASEMVEILAMDNEVTLTRLPKRPRLSNNNNNSSNNNSSNNDITPVVQRLGANPSISVRTLFPGEEEMNLHVNIEFQNVREVTPQGWEKCATMIQYDRDTKHLWQKLQRPYGNQSSFLRHLILLEKYYRAGDLILAPNASRNAINYSTSVQNRLISYEGPEKMDEPIMEPIAAEYNPRRLSGGYMMEKDRLSMPSTSSMSRLSTSGGSTLHSIKPNSPRMLKLNSGVSIIKKSPPNLQRLNLSASSSGGERRLETVTTNGSGNVKRQSLPASYGSSKVFQLSEMDMKRMQTVKRQKLNDRQSVPSTSNESAGSRSPSGSTNYRSQYPKAQIVSGHSQQFQKHLRMQQEMLSRQSRGDFEPLICDMTRSATTINENSQNVIHNFNLPKSIQVTTKPSTSNPIPILPKIPKSLTVIPQTVSRPIDK